MDIQQLYKLTEKGENPSMADIHPLKDLVEEYPYFQTGIFTYLKALYLFDNEQFDEELKRLSIFVNDRKALFYYIFSDEYDKFFEQTGKKEVSEDKTSQLLNAFFEATGNDDQQTDFEYETLSSGLATIDYLSYLQETSYEETFTEKEEKAPELKHQDIIDTFISRAETDGGIRIELNTEESDKEQHEEKAEEAEDELNEDVFFTETLAGIYIKQKKYEKAYKIIKHLSLNYPKKNIYFADQLKFLEKLIINSKYKNTK
ncbi:hypothetical protein [Prevotella sp. 10(H)]|uniref:hypothetical protein n=1 Tax=Prevotella sp. 10(H) TaxID=1158294 RepID=UPI0004A6C171|nr:hypothetical protein [Prevotella sp. 10(H)]